MLVCLWTCVLPQHFVQYPASKATPLTLTMPGKPHVLQNTLRLVLCWLELMLSIICAKTSPRFCNVCGRGVEQLWSRARAGCYETLYVCPDQRVSARTICKLRRTISSCCLTRNLPPILQQILLQPEFADSITRLLEFGPREIACAFRRMLRIPFVHLPLPSRVTDCILSYLRMDFTP